MLYRGDGTGCNRHLTGDTGLARRFLHGVPSGFGQGTTNEPQVSFAVCPCRDHRSSVDDDVWTLHHVAMAVVDA